MRRTKTLRNKDVAYLKGDRNYTVFHFINGSRLIFSKTLRVFENHSNMAHFVRVHKSYLLNPAFVSLIKQEGNRIIILMQDGTEVQASRHRKKAIDGLKLNIQNLLSIGTNLNDKARKF